MLTIDGNCAAGGCARNASKLESAQAVRSEMILRNSFEDRSPQSVPGRVPHSAPVMSSTGEGDVSGRHDRYLRTFDSRFGCLIIPRHRRTQRMPVDTL